MRKPPPNVTVAAVVDIVINAKVDQGVTLATVDGMPLHLAVIDGGGNVVASGASVANGVFKAAMRAYDDFWRGSGHMTTVVKIN